MTISEKWVRAELSLLRPLLTNASLETSRTAQNRVGALMASTQRPRVRFEPCEFDRFSAEWAIPRRRKREGAILYLHGGGYVAGDLEYAKGFGAVLAAKHHIRVFCPAYRLAPEHPYPAALEDALTAYRYLLGEERGGIVLCGESAGGGLMFSLVARLREEGLELPRGLIPISPWCDLTLSGSSYEPNRLSDPALTIEQLKHFREMYGGDPTDPLVSPLFSDLAGMPDTLIFAGAGEILLDDAVRMHLRLGEAGCSSRLTVADGMWHAYILYGVRAARSAHSQISKFLDAHIGGCDE